MAGTEPLRAPVAWGLIAAVCAARLGLYLASAGPLAWGYMSDELYYLACADHLAWGYVDHPPLSIALLGVQRALLGDSLLALRLAPALMACATALLTALLARELGARRAGQALAALAGAVCPVFLGVTGFYSMNAIEPPLWAAAALLLARIVNGGDPRLWLALGVVLGLGLLNKISFLWLGLGLGVGLLATGARRWLATPWPWAAGLIAFTLFAPFLLWQVQHDWPTLEFIARASTEKMVPKSPLQFVSEQLLVTGLTLPLWIAGLVFYFASAAGRPHRILGWMWVTVFVLLMASGTSRANYVGPAYVVLLAAGAVVFERAARRPAWRWLPGATAAVWILGAALLAPLALEILPPERVEAYQRALGIEVPSEEQGVDPAVPYHLALRLGWPELIDALEEAARQLSPEERARAIVFSDGFGVSGAVDFWGPARGLPPGVGIQNNFWLWGPGATDGEVVIAVHASEETLRRFWGDVRPAGDFPCDYCSPWMEQLSLWICRDPRRPLREMWPEMKKFI